jgi:DNA-binding transcriptional ArsR family regulator
MARQNLNIAAGKEAWDRLAGESSRGYSAFCAYRDMGPSRSLRKQAASDKPATNLRQLQYWCSRWWWVERCQRYDDYREKEIRAQNEKEQRDMHKRHSNVALLGMNIAVKGLETLLTNVQNGGGNINPADLTRLLETAVKVERMARVDSLQCTELKELSPVRRMGRPRLMIDWNTVDALCSVQCTMEEIASALGVSVDTIDRAVKRDHKMTFAEYFKEKRKAGFVSLRRKQFQTASNGNVAMQIWLGKQWLDQRDRQEVTQVNDPLAELLEEFRKEHARLPKDPDDPA